MDAFAVAVCKGLAMKRLRPRDGIIVGAWVGGFQALMPTIGWFLGTGFEHYIKSIDHWIAFGLLAYIGIKMIIEALKPDSGEEGIEKDAPLNIREMFTLAVATSIDALAVGISFAFLNYPIASAAAIIGITTFVISIIGVYIGNFFGTRYKKKAEIVGGIILILIGLKILLEHLGILVL